jgi:hypothetical protein
LVSTNGEIPTHFNSQETTLDELAVLGNLKKGSSTEAAMG